MTEEDAIKISKAMGELYGAAAKDVEAADPADVGLNGMPVRGWREAYLEGCKDMADRVGSQFPPSNVKPLRPRSGRRLISRRRPPKRRKNCGDYRPQSPHRTLIIKEGNRSMNTGRLFVRVGMATVCLLYIAWFLGAWRYDEPGHGHCPSFWGCKVSDQR